jgi:hypothetical protein
MMENVHMDAKKFPSTRTATMPIVEMSVSSSHVERREYSANIVQRDCRGQYWK